MLKRIAFVLIAMAVATPAAANGAIKRAPYKSGTIYRVYEPRQPAPLIQLGLLGGGVILWDDPLRLVVDLNPFSIDLDPFVSERVRVRHIERRRVRARVR